MSYEIINEELKIAACNIGDLTLGMTQAILKNWPDGISIEELTLFTDNVSGYLTLNKEFKYYDLLLSTAGKYLIADVEERKEIRDKAPECLKSSIAVIQKFRVEKIISREISHASRGYICNRDRRIINEITDRETSEYMKVINAFRYGMMQGKRAERAKKKKTAQ